MKPLFSKQGNVLAKQLTKIAKGMLKSKIAISPKRDSKFACFKFVSLFKVITIVPTIASNKTSDIIISKTNKFEYKIFPILVM